MFNFISNYLFWTKVLNRLSLEKNWLWRWLPVKFISKWNLQQVPDKNLFKKELRCILGKFDEHIFDAIDVDIKNHIEELANQTLDHDFDFLGSGKVHLNPINWHQDFKSGFIWPKGIFYRRYQKTDLSNNADVKVPWELSRCHHLLWLGEAYLLTKEEKYAKEVVFQIEDWIEENPLMYSINWTCAMDVSIRAVNWLFAVNMILSSKSVTDKFISKINKSLYQHGFFIFNNLEKTIPYSANHYAANLTGLLYLGQLFKNTKKGKKWFDFALSEYYHEIRTQVLPSGIHFEKSISYHRLMTELFSYPVYMLFRLDIQIPVDIISRIQSMYNFIHSYIKPNGNAPLIGDNDDGRFLPFLKYNFLKHGYLLDCSSVDNNIISHGVGYKFKVKCSNIKSYLYDDAGFAILRKNSSYVFFSNSDESKFPTYNSIIGTHTHNDNLSFEFSIDEQDIIIDPGSFLYTSDIAKRNVFRSIKKHNSITVDSEELNILLDTHAFSVIKNSVIDKVTINDCNNSILCKGSYTTIKNKTFHERTIKLESAKLIIFDTINNSGPNHFLSYYLHFAENIDPTLIENYLIIDTNRYQIKIKFESFNKYNIVIQEDEYSPSYGVLKKTKTVELKLDFDDFINIKTIISWVLKSR